jgi:squalene-associated FAD-dependent desaturase
VGGVWPSSRPPGDHHDGASRLPNRLGQHRPLGALSVRVVVVGGGLAGIAAALDCADAGARVTLVEVRPQLGGAVYSFERDGLQMDNGQHVFLRCYAAYRALLARLGSDAGVFVQRRLEIPVVSPGGAVSVLRRTSLPAPLHLAGALLRYPHLTVAERVGAARAALALGRLDPGTLELDRRTFGEWLAAHGQGPRAMAALWDLIALPALNLPAAQASLGLAAFVFQRGLLEHADAGDIGFHRRPLSEIVGDPAERALRAAGVELRLGWRAEWVSSNEGGFEVWRGTGPGPSDGEGTGERDDGERRARNGGDCVSAEAVIVALPHARAASLIEPLDPRAAAGARGLRDSPIVNLHVVYDRRVCELPFAAGVGTPVQYVFDRSEAGGVEEGCQYLAVSLSGADMEMAMSVDALRERYLPALAELFPPARAARVERFLVTREHAATFRAQPGVGKLRAGPATAVPGLVLAGAWTDTGWPATLEGAVLSGHAAARCVLEALGCGRGRSDGARTGAE